MKSKKEKQLNIFNNITTVFLCLVITVFLLFTGLNGYVSIAQGKYTMFCIICGGYIVVMLLTVVECWIVGSIRCNKLDVIKIVKKSNSVQKCGVIYLFITWISAFASPYFPSTVIGVSRYEGALTISIYVICFLLVSVYGKVTKPFVYSSVAGIIAFDIICLLQFASLNPFGLYPLGLTYQDAYIEYDGAYLGTIGNVDYVAAFLCLAIPFLLITFLRVKDKKRWAILVPLVMSIYILIKMWVLAGVIGVVCGMVLSISFAIDTSEKNRRLIIVTISVCILIGIVLIFVFDTGAGMLHEAHELLHGRIDGSFGSGRIYIWEEVLEKVKERPLIGYGPDTMYNLRMARMNAYSSKYDVVEELQTDVAHNEYLNILFHQGIFAMFSYLAVLVFAIAGFIKNKARNGIVTVLGISLICYCIQAFFGIGFCATEIFLWIVLGLLCSYLNLEGIRC